MQELHDIPPEELDKILRFYAELVKSDGTDYEPESLRVMIACLDRHLREHGATASSKISALKQTVRHWKERQ